MRLALMILLVLAAACATSGIASAAQVDCSFGFFDTGGGTAAMHRAKAFQTSSKTFQDLPAAELTVDQGGGCMVVKFSGQLKAKSPQAARIRVTVGDATASPNQVELTTAENAYDGKAATFMLPSLGNGTVTAKIQLLSVKGGPITLGDYNMVVHHSQIGCMDARGKRC